MENRFHIQKLWQNRITYAIQNCIRDFNSPKIKRLSWLRNKFKNKTGLEIGGPSKIFQNNGFIPLYKAARRIDGCNFSNTTIWEGSISVENGYKYIIGKNGTQFILEASDLNQIPDLKYDFILSAHSLEHIANPLKAIKEWIRVLKKGGLILIVVPNKEYCFDHKREFTTMSHLLDDFENNIDEHDLTHLEEILRNHDLDMDKPAGTPEQFKERSLNNFSNRALHHHVFNLKVLEEVFRFFQLEILTTHAGNEFVILGEKSN